MDELNFNLAGSMTQLRSPDIDNVAGIMLDAARLTLQKGFECLRNNVSLLIGLDKPAGV